MMWYIGMFVGWVIIYWCDMYWGYVIVDWIYDYVGGFDFEVLDECCCWLWIWIIWNVIRWWYECEMIYWFLVDLDVCRSECWW